MIESGPARTGLCASGPSESHLRRWRVASLAARVRVCARNSDSPSLICSRSASRAWKILGPRHVPPHCTPWPEVAIEIDLLCSSKSAMSEGQARGLWPGLWLPRSLPRPSTHRLVMTKSLSPDLWPRSLPFVVICACRVLRTLNGSDPGEDRPVVGPLSDWESSIRQQGIATTPACAGITAI
jgi:hypothetical protein